MKQITLKLTVLLFTISAHAQWTDNGNDMTTLDDLTVTGHVNIGGEGNYRLRVRHIDGKNHTNSAQGSLYLNYGLNSPVLIGYGGGSPNLLVNGKIGVGTTSPSHQLHVQSPGGDNQTARIYLRGTGQNNAGTVNNIGLSGALISGTADAASFGRYNVGLESWYGIGFKSTFNNKAGIVFNTRNASAYFEGNVGIGIDYSSAKLEVRGSIKTSIDNSRSLTFHTNGDGNSYINYVGGSSSSRIGFQIDNGSAMSILNNRSVGIGTTNTGNHKLAVNGSIRSKEVKVEANWSDFVFYDDYVLRTLEEVEEYIAEKGHLPEIPSEAEVKENGINLGEMNAKLLQKIEELTLYLIEQNKQNQAQQAEIEALKEMNIELLKKLENK